MDSVLSPKLYWIGDRCYRVNSMNESLNTNTSRQADGESVPAEEEGKTGDRSQSCEPTTEANAQCDAPTDEVGSQVEYDIVFLEDKKHFSASLRVAKPLHSALIGSKGSTRRSIEQQFKCHLKIPAKEDENAFVNLTGETRENVEAALRKIEQLVQIGRFRADLTHFPCVPVLQPNIVERFDQLRQAIVSGPAVFGLDESMFMKLTKLHLTIGVMSLMDDFERQLAIRLLQECQQLVIKPILRSNAGSLELRVKGLACMNDNPERAHVLYACVDSEALQQIADQIRDVFVANGLMKLERDHVKLHVTFINSRYREDKNTDPNSRRKQRQPFDARAILQQFGDYDFGTQRLTEVHLSRFGAKDENGFYAALSVLKVF